MRISDGDQEVNMTEAQHAAADIIQHGEWDERYISLRIAKAIRDEMRLWTAETETRNAVEFSELDGARCEVWRDWPYAIVIAAALCYAAVIAITMVVSAASFREEVGPV